MNKQLYFLEMNKLSIVQAHIPTAQWKNKDNFFVLWMVMSNPMNLIYLLHVCQYFFPLSWQSSKSSECSHEKSHIIPNFSTITVAAVKLQHTYMHITPNRFVLNERRKITIQFISEIFWRHFSLWNLWPLHFFLPP